MFENFVTRADKGSVEYCADLGMAFKKAETEVATAIKAAFDGLENFNALHTDTPIADDDGEALADIAATDDLIAGVLGDVYEFEGAGALVFFNVGDVSEGEFEASREFALGAWQCWRVLRWFRGAFGADMAETVKAETESLKALVAGRVAALRKIAAAEDELIGARVRVAVVYLESSVDVLTSLVGLLDPLNDYLNRCDTRSEYN